MAFAASTTSRLKMDVLREQASAEMDVRMSKREREGKE